MADNPPAFPLPSGISSAPGMTLLDYFTSAALQGVLAHHGSQDDDQGLREQFAYDAYAFADAMLAEREKRNG